MEQQFAAVVEADDSSRSVTDLGGKDGQSRHGEL
jgi:hypothetical protein